MITFFKSWCEGIIIAVILSIIIESILPEGNNKKYVKVIIGIYIIFTIFNPILGSLNSKNIDFNNMINFNTIETSSVNTKSIQEVYANSIEESMKQNLEEKFKIEILELNILYDDNYENIEQINIKIKNSNIKKIEEVNISGVSQNENNNNYEEIKDYIIQNYEIDKNFININ